MLGNGIVGKTNPSIKIIEKKKKENKFKVKQIQSVAQSLGGEHTNEVSLCFYCKWSGLIVLCSPSLF